MSHSPTSQELQKPQLKTDVVGRAPGRHRTFFLLAFLVLLLEFLLNPIGVADQYWFRTHQTDSEAIVVARMIPASDDGFFAVGGFLRILDGDFNTNAPKIFEYYVEDSRPLPSARFEPYTGQVGLHGHVFAAAELIMRAAGLESRQRFLLLRGAVATATAATLAYIVLLIRFEFGLAGAFAALATLLFSPWLTSMAKNIYWIPFTWFVPMVVAWRGYIPSSPPVGKKLLSLAVSIGAAVAFKCLCGFEYITSIGGAAASVAAYGLIKGGADWKRIFTHAAILLGAMACGVISALLVQISILGMYLGSFKAGMVDFIQRLHVHTSIGERLQQHRSVSEEYLNALHTSHLETLLTYIQGPPIFSAGSYFGFNALSFLTPPTIFIITIGSILLTRYRGDPSRQREVLALLALATGGLVSSMSWFLFAHGHSYIHTHINYILWHVPYAFLAAPICIRLAQISRGIKLA